MSYNGASDPKLPDHVKKMPAQKRSAFASAYNSAHDRCMKESGEDCEGVAMATANAAANRAQERSFGDDTIYLIEDLLRQGAGLPKDPSMFAVVGDPEKPSTWKLPIHDASHVAAAITALSPSGFRGQPVRLTPEDRAKAIRKISARINQLPIDDDQKEHLQERLNSLQGGTSRSALYIPEDFDDLWTPAQLVRQADFHSHPDYTVYYMNGIPYEGMLFGKFDSHMTDWGPDTDVGPLGRTMTTFFEHGRFPEIDFDQMGDALMMTDDMIRQSPLSKEDIDGRIFKVVVEKANKYHDFLARLNERGILRGSAQFLASSYKVHPKTRKVERAVPGEYSFLVDPSNLLNRPIQVMRSINFPVSNWDLVEEFYKMENEVKTVTTEVTNSASITERVEEALERSAQVVQESEATPDTLQILLRSLAQDLGDLKAVMQTSNANSELLRGLEVKFDAISERQTKLEDAIVKLADGFAASLERGLATATRNALALSEPEKQTLFRSVQREEGRGNTPGNGTKPQTPRVIPIPGYQG